MVEVNEDDNGLPIAVGQAVEFAEGEDPFDESSSQGEAEDDGEDELE